MIPHTCISFNIRRYLTSSWSDSFVWQIMVVSPASLAYSSIPKMHSEKKELDRSGTRIPTILVSILALRTSSLLLPEAVSSLLPLFFWFPALPAPIDVTLLKQLQQKHWLFLQFLLRLRPSASLSAGSVSSAYFWSFRSISSLYFYIITHFAQSKCSFFTFFYLSCWILCRKSAVFSFRFILFHKFFCLLSFDCRLQTMPAVKINITKIYPFLDFSPPDRMNISIKKEM